MTEESKLHTWRHIDGWIQAAEELKVLLIGPAKIDLGEVGFLDVDMYFPQFGPRSGMVVVNEYHKIQQHRLNLLENGYGYSVFEVSDPGVRYSATDLAEMLTDWQWNGAADDRPDWLIESQ